MADQPKANHAEARHEPSAAIFKNAQRMSGGKTYE
jgi:hypothetical protein